MPKTLIALGLICLATGSGCTHHLEVKNLDNYRTLLKLGTTVTSPNVAITPFEGKPDDVWFFNAIVERLSQDPAIGHVQTDYSPRTAEREDRARPDVVLSVRPKVTYRTSGWNFLINWPGFLIFTPAWNGYVYHADVMTSFEIGSADGEVLDELKVPMTFSIRHADGDRTIFAGLAWFEVSLLALGGGIYNANVFDRDVIHPLQVQIRETYVSYTLAQAQRRVIAIADQLRPPEPELPAATSDEVVEPQDPAEPRPAQTEPLPDAARPAAEGPKTAAAVAGTPAPTAEAAEPEASEDPIEQPSPPRSEAPASE